MADKKIDGVVEAVRYTPEGMIEMVRVYLRRGPTWSDRMLLSRDDFIAILKTGKHMVTGKRVEFMAGTFDVSQPVQVKGKDGQEILYTSATPPSEGRSPSEGRDTLEGVPLF